MIRDSFKVCHHQRKVGTHPTTKGKLAYITPPEESKYVNHHHRKISTHTTTREKLAHTLPPELEIVVELVNLVPSNNFA